MLLKNMMLIQLAPAYKTLISGFRQIMFLFNGCLVRNQPESVLKLFLILK